MIYVFDNFDRFEQPEMILCNPDDEEIGVIANPEDVKITINLNEVSELSYKIYNNDNELTDKNGIPIEAIPNIYRKHIERREVLVQGIGYFIITEIREFSNEEGTYKEVTAKSCEYELNNINIPYIDGTYPLYNTNLKDQLSNYDRFKYLGETTTTTVADDDTGSYRSDTCILYEVLSCCPSWSLSDKTIEKFSEGSAYESLANKERTFESEDITVYTFLKENIQDAYNCFISFNIFDRTIDILPYSDVFVEIPYILSNSNILDSCEVSSTIDDYVNSLKVSGGTEDVYISDINPNGTNIIYNFDHDLKTGIISGELAEAINYWKSHYSSSESNIPLSYGDDGALIPVNVFPKFEELAQKDENGNTQYSQSEGNDLYNFVNESSKALNEWVKDYQNASAKGTVSTVDIPSTNITTSRTSKSAIPVWGVGKEYKNGDIVFTNNNFYNCIYAGEDTYTSSSENAPTLPESKYWAITDIKQDGYATFCFKMTNALANGDTLKAVLEGNEYTYTPTAETEVVDQISGIYNILYGDSNYFVEKKEDMIYLIQKNTEVSAPIMTVVNSSKNTSGSISLSEVTWSEITVETNIYSSSDYEEYDKDKTYKAGDIVKINEKDEIYDTIVDYCNTVRKAYDLGLAHIEYGAGFANGQVWNNCRGVWKAETEYKAGEVVIWYDSENKQANYYTAVNDFTSSNGSSELSNTAIWTTDTNFSSDKKYISTTFGNFDCDTRNDNDTATYSSFGIVGNDGTTITNMYIAYVKKANSSGSEERYFSELCNGIFNRYSSVAMAQDLMILDFSAEMQGYDEITYYGRQIFLAASTDEQEIKNAVELFNYVGEKGYINQKFSNFEKTLLGITDDNELLSINDVIEYIFYYGEIWDLILASQTKTSRGYVYAYTGKTLLNNTTNILQLASQLDNGEISSDSYKATLESWYELVKSNADSSSASYIDNAYKNLLKLTNRKATLYKYGAGTTNINNDGNEENNIWSVIEPTYSWSASFGSNNDNNVTMVQAKKILIYLQQEQLLVKSQLDYLDKYIASYDKSQLTKTQEELQKLTSAIPTFADTEDGKKKEQEYYNQVDIYNKTIVMLENIIKVLNGQKELFTWLYSRITAWVTALEKTISATTKNYTFQGAFKDYASSKGLSDEEAEEKALKLYYKLTRMLKQQTYTNENIIITTAMDFQDIYDAEEELYTDAISMLNSLIDPSSEVTIEAEAFMFNKEYQEVVEGLFCYKDGDKTQRGVRLGAALYCELPNGEVPLYHINAVEVNYQEPSCTITLGNRLNTNDPAAVLSNLEATSASTADIVAANRIDWGASSTKVNELMAERNVDINTTARGMANSINNISLGSEGLKCFAKDPVTNQETYGFWGANGTLMFQETDADGNKTNKAAVGRIIKADGTTEYGFYGDSIIANTITAEKLAVGSVSTGTNLIRNGSFEFKENMDNQSATTLSNWTDTNGKTVFAIKNSKSPYGDYCYNLTSDGLMQTDISGDGGAYTFSFYYAMTPQTSNDNVITITAQLLTSEGNLVTQCSVTNTTDSNINTWNRKYIQDFSVSDSGGVDRVIFTVTGADDTNLAYVDAVMLEKSSLCGVYSNHSSEYNSKYTVINDSGIRIFDGNLSIFNSGGTRVLYADSNGNLVLNNIKAESGTIGGWTIASNYLAYKDGNDVYTHGMSTNSSYPAFWAGFTGNDKPSNSATYNTSTMKFMVKQDGSLFASSGKIGGWTIKTTSLTSSDGNIGLDASASGSDKTFWAGGNNFYVEANGTLHANNAVLNGYVSASDYKNLSGANISNSTIDSTTAGGWTIGAYTLYKTDGGNNDCSNLIDAGDNFKVSSSGILTANDAIIKGDITATNLTLSKSAKITSGDTSQLTINNYQIFFKNQNAQYSAAISPFDDSSDSNATSLAIAGTHSVIFGTREDDSFCHTYTMEKMAFCPNGDRYLGKSSSPWYNIYCKNFFIYKSTNSYYQLSINSEGYVTASEYNTSDPSTK